MLGISATRTRTDAAAVAYPATGANAAGIQTVVDQFSAALGLLNPNVPGSFLTGRREINWDGVPDAEAAPNNLPVDFPNLTMNRGIQLTSPTQLFQVSANSPPRFGNINASYEAEFVTFTAPRLFAPINANVFTVRFYVPGTGVPATVNGFGAVFTDVDRIGQTKMEFFAPGGESLGVFYVPPQDNGLSFQGAIFNAGERVASVAITLGNKTMDASNNDVDGTSSASDIVVMDDFIYGEPVPYPNAFAILDNSNNHIVRFNTRTPKVIQLEAPFANLANANLLAIDFRPATETLYGLGVVSSNGRLVEMNDHFVVAAKGPPFTVSGTTFGFDFDPVADLVRVTSEADLNITLNPDDGSTHIDSPVTPASASIVGLAYSNNVAGAATGTSTLFGLDSAADKLVKFSDPRFGDFTEVGVVTDSNGALNFSDTAGFDIQAYTNTAYATLTVGGVSALYTIDTDDAEARKLDDSIGVNLLVRGLALVPQHPSVFTAPPSTDLVGVDTSNHLVKFNSDLPQITTVVAISGLQPNEQAQEIDYRPANGKFYLLGVTEGGGANDGVGRFYEVNINTGVATQVGQNPFTTVFPDNASYGMDIDGEADHVRVVNSGDQLIFVDPNQGVGGGGGLSINNPFGPETITAIASIDYTPDELNSVTIYGIDYQTDSLVLIGPFDGSFTPNSTTVNPIGITGVVTGSNHIGFDIAVDTGAAFAAMTSGSVTRLYNIDLKNGFAFGRGKIGDGMTELRGLAVMQTPLRIKSIARTGNDITITFNGTKGRKYRLERKLSLSDFDWESPVPGVADITANANGPAVFLHPGGASQPHGFYRVSFVRPP